MGPMACYESRVKPAEMEANANHESRRNSNILPRTFFLIAVPKIEIQNGLAGDIPTIPVCWLEQPKACGINSGLREVIDQRSPARERFRLHDPTLIVN